jgi:hypothetical protein
MESQASPNALNSDQSSPLHTAYLWRRTPMAELLLQRGAQPDLLNMAGKTPAEMAALPTPGGDDQPLAMPSPLPPRLRTQPGGPRPSSAAAAADRSRGLARVRPASALPGGGFSLALRSVNRSPAPTPAVEQQQQQEEEERKAPVDGDDGAGIEKEPTDPPLQGAALELAARAAFVAAAVDMSSPAPAAPAAAVFALDDDLSADSVQFASASSLHIMSHRGAVMFRAFDSESDDDDEMAQPSQDGQPA